MNYRMWHFRGEYIFENTIVRMQIAICDDEKSIGLILEEKIKKLLPDAVIEKYLHTRHKNNLADPDKTK